MILPAVLVALVGLVAAAAPAPSAFAQADPGHEAVKPSADPVPGQYIVTLRKDVGIASVDAAAGALTEKHGGRVLETYDATLHGYAVATTPEGAQALADDPAVASVEQDGYVHTSTTQAPAPSWGLDRIDQSALPLDNSYSFTTGAPSVHAYVVDTGINMALPDFGGRATVGTDLVGGVSPPGSDCSGHGTHVAGTIGGSTYGVAKRVQLVSVRVLDCGGSGTFSNVIAGVNWITANAVKPAVVNMSLGGAQSASLDAAIDTSIASGISYFVAAGNSHVDACGSSPSDVANAVVVGATDQTDTRALFSNFGSCVDLFAPGVGIVSDLNVAPFTGTKSGTSMATPHVAGVAAQYLQRHPSASPADVATALVAHASNTVVNAGTGSPNALLDDAFVEGGLPDPPLLSAAANVGTVNLTWAVGGDGGSPITGFNIARGTTPGNETPLVSNLSPALSAYADSTGVPGTTYSYTITATNGTGTSAVSNEVSASPSLANPNPSWTSLGGIVTADPAAAPDPTNPSGAYVFVRGGDGAMYWKHATGGTWSSYNNAGGLITTQPIAISDPTGVSGAVAVYVFARGADGGLYVGTIVNGTWTGWQGLGGLLTSRAAAAIDSSGLWVAVRGGDNGLYVRRLLGGSSWSSWQAMGGYLATPPSLIADSSSGILAFVGGGDNGLYVRGVSSGSPWQPLGGLITAAPGAVAHASEKSVFVRGSDGTTYLRHAVGSQWDPYVSLGGYTTSEPIGVAGTDGVSLYVRGGDGALYRKHFDGQWGAWARLGNFFNADPTAIIDGSGFERVFVVGGDGALYTLSVHNSSS
jgi:subtilisin family serine protease